MMMNPYLRHIQQLSVAHFLFTPFLFAPVQFPTVSKDQTTNGKRCLPFGERSILLMWRTSDEI